MSVLNVIRHPRFGCFEFVSNLSRILRIIKSDYLFWNVTTIGSNVLNQRQSRISVLWREINRTWLRKTFSYEISSNIAVISSGESTLWTIGWELSFESRSNTDWRLSVTNCENWSNGALILVHVNVVKKDFTTVLLKQSKLWYIKLIWKE